MTNGEFSQEDDNGGYALQTVDGTAGFAVWVTDNGVDPPASVTSDGAAPDGEPLPDGVFHLLIADEDVAHRTHMASRPCAGTWVWAPQLPPSCVEHWCASQSWSGCMIWSSTR